MKKYLFTPFLLLMSASVLANNCQPENSEINLCKFSEHYVNSIKESMPLDDDLIRYRVDDAESVGKLIKLKKKLPFDQKTFNYVLIYTGKNSYEVMENVKKSARNNVCRPGTGINYFIKAGGHVEYTFLFSDNKEYEKFIVNNC